jgi:Tol biopolymer transport system component
MKKTKSRANSLSAVMLVSLLAVLCFAINSYSYHLSVTVEPPGSGTVDFSPFASDGIYPDGQTVWLTPRPSTDNSFSHWADGYYGDYNPLSITPVSDTSLTAYFTPTAPGPIDGFNIERVSVASDGTQGNFDSRNSYSRDISISADGRYVAFQSYASNLVPGDTNNSSDVFVRDRLTGATERVSVNFDGTQANGDSQNPSISADGRYVAFESVASTLVPGDTNGMSDIFIHDRQTGTTERVSVASDGTQGNSYSGAPSISADGRYVAFYSGASNIVPGDTNGQYDIFVRDMQTGTTERVSVATNGAQGNGDSNGPSISADGRYVSFASVASTLVSGDTNGMSDIFIHDRQTGATERVSVATNGAQGNEESNGPSINADGRYVAFCSDASNLVLGDTNRMTDVFVHDRQVGATERVSIGDGIPDENNYWSWAPSISADGRYVAFSSETWSMEVFDLDMDVLVHDRQTGENWLLSENYNRIPGNANSFPPVISADGRYVAFCSFASNLVSGDTNSCQDVFVATNVPNANALQHKLNATLMPQGAGFLYFSPSHEGNLYADGEEVRVGATPWPGYVFSHWSGDATGTENPFWVVMNSDLAFAANFTVETSPPSSSITAPVAGSVVSGSNLSITGTATDGDMSQAGVLKVEVSTNGGSTWNLATGTTSWSYAWTLPADGSYNIKTRATDNAGNIEVPGAGVTVVVDNTPPISVITSPTDGTTLDKLAWEPTEMSRTISGIAADNGGSGVARVYVSLNGGITWVPATGTTEWSYNWTVGSNGQHRILSKAVDVVGNTETPGHGIKAYTSSYDQYELPHRSVKQNPDFNGCGICHFSGQSIFLPTDYADSSTLCYSCHNAAGVTHDVTPAGTRHMMADASSPRVKFPSYGNVTAVMPGGKVNCVTCHDPMTKYEDMNRRWEWTATSDGYKFRLYNGGWGENSYLKPRIYRKPFGPEPIYPYLKKYYLHDPAEYSYNEYSGTIIFKTKQAYEDRPYGANDCMVAIDYPYLRVSNTGNTMCLDCHTQTTHKGSNCLTCHTAHNTPNRDDIRQSVRTTDLSEQPVVFNCLTGAGSFADGDATRNGICEVCHTQTKYYRRDGTGFVNHSGGVNYDRTNCTVCHTHGSGFAR